MPTFHIGSWVTTPAGQVLQITEFHRGAEEKAVHLSNNSCCDLNSLKPYDEFMAWVTEVRAQANPQFPWQPDLSRYYP